MQPPHDPREPAAYPTPWQRKTLWTAVTLLSLTVILAVVAAFLYVFGTIVGFLQPLLLPVAVAGILAYLLDPVVNRFCRWWRLSRTAGVGVVFALFTGLTALLFVLVVPEIWGQTARLAAKAPEVFMAAKRNITAWIETVQTGGAQNVLLEEAEKLVRLHWADWLQQLWAFVQSNIGGFLGGFGFLLGFLLVPVYLFFMLKHSASIAAHWSEYLPLRASAFRDEVVAVLTEVNGYLINFFRGQMLVSLIDGVLTGLALQFIVGLDYSFVIAALVAALGIIPYLGIVLSLIPALLVAAAQFGDWQHPLLVLGIFLAVQNLDGILIAPKIVGDSVGLHPMTVILSVIAWSLVLKGLLGTLLAVPLTATLKVLFRRYIWVHLGRQSRSGESSPAPAE